MVSPNHLIATLSSTPNNNKIFHFRGPHHHHLTFHPLFPLGKQCRSMENFTFTEPPAMVLPRFPELPRPQPRPTPSPLIVGPKTVYNSSESFMDFLQGLTYEHVDFIFSDTIYPQESENSTINTYAYKYEYSENHTFPYYDNYDAYAINNQTMVLNMANDSTTTVHSQQVAQSSSSFRTNPTECESNHNGIWEDTFDPDYMTYEELVELGEIVGSQSRGLSQETVLLLPVSKFKCGFFSRKKSTDERCVICQMEYKRGEKQITLPCEHIYHADCGSQWLNINKACPICFKEVHHVHVLKNTKKISASAGKKGRVMATVISHLKSIFRGFDHMLK